MDAINDAKRELQLSIIDFLRQNYGELPAAKKEFTLIAVNHLMRVYGIDYPGETVDIPHSCLKKAFAHHLKTEVGAIANMRHKLLHIIIRYLKIEADRSTGDRLMMIFVALHNLDKVSRGTIPEEYLDDLPAIYKCFKAAHFNRLANDYYGAELYKESVEEYTNAVVLDPLNTLYLCNRAMAFVLLKNFNAAVIDSKTAIGLDGNCIKAYSHLGLAYMKQDMLKESIDAYKSAAVLDPANSIYRDKIQLLEARIVYKQHRGSHMRLTMRKADSESQLRDSPSTSKFPPRRSQ